MSAPVAALPMYDLPSLQAANDQLWAAIARGLVASGVSAPAALNRSADLEAIWRSPGLVLAQTCGYPLTTALRGKVQLVATPRYRAPGCTGAYHRAAIVVSERSGFRDLADLRGRVCAVNTPDSNTGMNLLRAEVAEIAGAAPFFGEVIFTGSHLESARRISRGEADVAAIDCVTLAHLQGSPAMEGVRTLGWTRATPCLPLITRGSASPDDVKAIQDTVMAATADPRQRDALWTLRIDGFDLLTAPAYDPIITLERRAAALGYPVLR